MTPNIYAGGTLDRAAHRRRDERWLAAAWHDQAARVLPLSRGRCLLQDKEATLLPSAWAADRLHTGWAFLGLTPVHAPIFALELDSNTPETLVPPNAGTWTDLRTAATTIPADQAAMLAYARAMLEWRRRTRFCSLCGAPCRVEQAGHVMLCTACGTQHFPRTDPTVIMLVTHSGRALLGHATRFPNSTMYSTLAGFMEPGESMEEAVAREVLEETNIEVGAIRYHSSQPWPFPANLMIGFHAEALTDAITIDPAELTDARWFTRAELRNPRTFTLPPTFSIARRMIDGWVGEERT